MATALILAVGCGGDDSGSSDTKEDASTTKADAATKSDASTKADAGTDTTAGDPVAGKAVATKYICTSCHGEDYEGAGLYPNITPDEDTGIGSWTDQQIKDAVTKGIDDEGDTLCSTMPRQTLTATQQSDLVAYLRSLDPVVNDTPDMCN